MNMVLRVRASHVSRARTNSLENSFFPSTSKSWDDLDDEAKAKPSPACFKDYLNNNYIRPVSKKTFTNCDTKGISILTKIRVEFSDLRDHRYNHNFNCISPTCKCTRDRETSVHYFLRCPLYERNRTTLLSKISDIIHSDVRVLPDDHLLHILLYGSNMYNTIVNKLVIEATIKFIHQTGRFKYLEAFSNH